MNLHLHAREQNTLAIDAGLEPPLRVVYRCTSDPGLDDEPCVVSRPTLAIDEARFRAFTQLLYEVHVVIRFFSVSAIFLLAAILAPGLLFVVAFLALWRCIR